MGLPRRWSRAALLIWALLTSTTSGQTPTVASRTGYTVADEAALGQAAAAAIQSRTGALDDPGIQGYVNGLARRLVDALRAELKHPGFDYRVIVLDDHEIVSLAVPGGPVFISRTTIELAPNDAALAGVLAHELSHIALRHATAQATAAERYQLGEITGMSIAAAASDGTLDIMTRAAYFAVTSYFLAFGADEETEADALAGDLMRRSGYDPGALPAMLNAVRHDALARGSWWPMRHRLKRDAGGIEATDADEPSPALAAIQERLRALEAEPSHAPHRPPGPIGTIGYSVVPPSGDSRTVTAGDSLLLSVPTNWERLPTGSSVIFAPPGAYLRAGNGSTNVTHGVQIGIARSLIGSVHGDVHALLGALGRNNPSLTWVPAFQEIEIGGRPGITTSISHVSPVTGEFEAVTVSGVHLSDGTLLYVIGLAPQDDAGVYRNAFTRVLDSIQILD